MKLLKSKKIDILLLYKVRVNPRKSKKFPPDRRLLLRSQCNYYHKKIIAINLDQRKLIRHGLRKMVTNCPHLMTTTMCWNNENEHLAFKRHFRRQNLTTRTLFSSQNISVPCLRNEKVHL